MALPVPMLSKFHQVEALSETPTPPPSPRTQLQAQSVQRSFRCLACAFGTASVISMLGGGYAFFSVPQDNSDGSENYSQQLLGIALLAVGVLGCLTAGCLAQHKSAFTRSEDLRDGRIFV